MPKKTSLFTLVSLLLLSACGGSDGPVIDNTTKPADKPADKPEVTDQTGKGFNTHQIVTYHSSSSSELLGKGMHISHDDFKYDSTTESENEGKNFEKIEINGQLMEIYPKEKPSIYYVPEKKNGYDIVYQGEGDNTVGDSSTKTYRMATGRTAYSTYGLIADEYKNEYVGDNEEAAKACENRTCQTIRVRLFYQGQPTLDMPTTGTAKYEGGAIMSVFTSNHMDNLGDSSFNVDFGKKSIDGKITNIKGRDNLKDITLKTAKIQGNAFKNDQMEGKFHGPKAAAVSGYFIDKKQNLHGVFGAEKVKK